MANTRPDHAEDLARVSRARQGDHGAFVALYREDAPPAWRLALALTADPERAARAVADGFRRALAPERPGEVRSDQPFRVRLLTATRHAVLDGPRPTADAPLHTPGRDLDPAVARPGTVRTAEVMAAFHQLPERSRTILWLLVVEGLGTAEAAPVLGLRRRQAEALTDRSLDALDEQWWLDRRAAGETEGITEVPDGLVRHLQPLLPLPADLFAVSERAWRADRRRAVGPLGLALPGGRPVPRWAERALVGATAALIAAGIAGAVVIDGDPSSPRRHSTVTASRDEHGGDSGAVSGAGPTGSGPSALDQPVAADLFGSATAATTPPTVGAQATTIGTPYAVDPNQPAGGAAPQQPTAPTTKPPLVQATVGVAPLVGVALGDCTGLDLAGTVVGCKPATNPSGVTLKVGGSLLGQK